MFKWIGYGTGIGHLKLNFFFSSMRLFRFLSRFIDINEKHIRRIRALDSIVVIQSTACHLYISQSLDEFIHLHTYARILLLYLFLGRIHCSDHIIYSLNLTIANEMPYFMYQYIVYGTELCVAVYFKFSTQIEFIRLFRYDHLFSLFIFTVRSIIWAKRMIICFFPNDLLLFVDLISAFSVSVWVFAPFISIQNISDEERNEMK